MPQEGNDKEEASGYLRNCILSKNYLKRERGKKTRKNLEKRQIKCVAAIQVFYFYKIMVLTMGCTSICGLEKEKRMKNRTGTLLFIAFVFAIFFHGVAIANDLHRAAIEGKTDQIDKLLKEGININERNAEGLTPLHEAIGALKFSTAEKLVKAGADVNAKGLVGRTALMFACIIGLRPGKVYNAATGNEMTSRSIRYSNAEGKVHPDEGQFDFVKFLVKNGADPKMRDDENKVALHFAAENGYVEIVKYLVEQCGSDVNASNFYGAVPLHYAARHNYPQIAAFLMQKDADINATFNGNGDSLKGLTPLMVAVFQGHETVVKLLLSKGANLNLKDASGKTALDYAKKANDQEIVQLLENAQHK